MLTTRNTFIFVIFFVFACPLIAQGLSDDTATYQYASLAARINWPGDQFDSQFSSAPLLGRFDVEDKDLSRPATVALRNFSGQGRITLAIRSSGLRNGVAHFFSKENNKTMSPILSFTSQGQPYFLRPVTDTVVNQKVRAPQNEKTTLKASRDFTVLMQFDLPENITIQSLLQEPKLSLYLTNRQSGDSQFNVYYLQPKALKPKVENTGIASRYSKDKGIIDDARVFYADDFDQDSLFNKLANKLGIKKSKWDNTNELEFRDHKLVSHFLQGEGKSLLIPFKTDRNLAANLDYLFARHHSVEPEEAYFRYYMMFDGRGWVSGGGKFPGFSGTYNKAGWGGRANNGNNGWSARGAFFASVPQSSSQWTGRLPIGSYLYEIDTKNRYGQTIPWGNPASALQPGKWYCIEQRLKLNTPGKQDGVLQVWIDGQQAFLREDMHFRSTDKLKIEKVWFNFYFGGRDKPQEAFNLFADNFVIASSYIGPVQ